MVPAHVILRTVQCYNITNGTCTCYIKDCTDCTVLQYNKWYLYMLY